MTEYTEKKRFIGNFGDVNWLGFGGLLLFEYKGEYTAYKIDPCIEFENGNIDDIHDPEMVWEIFRFDIPQMKVNENCELVDENDNKEWFSDDTKAIASFYGQENDSYFLYCICSNDPNDRLFAYEMIASYWGYNNLDSYPEYWNKEQMKKLFPMVPGIEDLENE